MQWSCPGRERGARARPRHREELKTCPTGLSAVIKRKWQQVRFWSCRGEAWLGLVGCGRNLNLETQWEAIERLR